MKNKSKFIMCFALIITWVVVDFLLAPQVLRNVDNPNDEDLTFLKFSQGTVTVPDTAPYGGIIGYGSIPDRGEQDYLEWNITTIYGPGLTWYMMNDTEHSDFVALQNEGRTRGSFSYTALLSDEEASASGTFYPHYSDQWWFLTTNHYTGIACQVTFTYNWEEDFITIIEPTNSSSWEVSKPYYITWTWGGNFDNVNIDLYKAGAFELEIVSSTPNDGDYSWVIPSGLDDSTRYSIKITNAGISSIYDYSYDFEIYTIIPTNGGPGIPGYSIIILISTAILLSIFFLKKRSKIKLND